MIKAYYIGEQDLAISQQDKEATLNRAFLTKCLFLCQLVTQTIGSWYETNSCTITPQIRFL